MANGHTVGVVAEAVHVLGVLGQVPQRGSDRRPGGVDPGDEQEGDRSRTRARPLSGMPSMSACTR